MLSTTQFVHDSGRIVLELQGGNVTAVYSYGNSLVARNGEVVLADGLGTTRATVDSTQAVTSTLTTEAFGNTVAQWGSSANPYRFAGDWGYRDDGDMGLLYIGARWYDPAVGQWTSADKWLGNIYRPLSLNRYLYCEHEPVMRVDPSGYRPAKEYWDWFWGSIGAAIGGSIGGLLAPEVGGAWFGMGIGAPVGLAVGDAIWEGGEQVYDTVRDAWNWLAGKLSKLREYNAMLEELGL